MLSIRLLQMALVAGLSLPPQQPLAAKVLNNQALLQEPAVLQSLTEADATLYRQAFAALKDNNWQTAKQLAAQANDQTLATYITWNHLRYGTDITFPMAVSFLDKNRHWPLFDHIQKRSERTLTISSQANSDNDTLIKNWFDRNPPLTTTGRLRYLELVPILAQADLARQLWRENQLSTTQQREFLAKHQGYLRPSDHRVRLNMLLWGKKYAEAQRLRPLLSNGDVTLLDARKAVQQRRRNRRKVIASVPSAQQKDQGLTYDRIRLARKSRDFAEARALLKTVNAPVEYAAKWWVERGFQVRELLEERQWQQAYQLAAGHQQPKHTGGFADAEFIAGWVALQRLDQPDLALTHFERLTGGVSYPISLARGLYWQGRAFAQLGKTPEANGAYLAASKHYVTFYGQLAATEIGLQPNAALLVSDALPSLNEFYHNQLARAAIQLAAIGEGARAKPLLHRLIELEKNPNRRRAVTGLARQLGDINLSVALAKRTKNMDALSPGTEFPVVALPPLDGPEPALIFAIIRQESVFAADARSHVGARGLMQLMPATARMESRAIGRSYSLGRLTSDPAYNIQLGAAHLRRGLKTFDGSYPLTIAAYNAGPGNVQKWLKKFGDPRLPVGDPNHIDLVDWMELIPFRETRNYVQRVLEGLEVYRLRLQHYPEIIQPPVLSTAWCSYSCGGAPTTAE